MAAVLIYTGTKAQEIQNNGTSTDIMEGTTTSAIVLVPEKSLEEKILDTGDTNALQLLQEKKGVDNLLSTYAQKYDTCRFTAHPLPADFIGRLRNL